MQKTRDVKLCCVCQIELTPKRVYGGFMGFMYRLIFRSKGWKDFYTCQECRDLRAAGYTHEQIRELRT